MGGVVKALFGEPEQKELPPPEEPNELEVKRKKRAQLQGGKTQTILTSPTGLGGGGTTLLGE